MHPSINTSTAPSLKKILALMAEKRAAEAFLAAGSPMKTLVIGAGPAGAACALWLHQLGCPVLLVEKSDQAGGLLRTSPYENPWVPSVSGLRGQDIAERLHSQMAYREVPFVVNKGVLSVHPAQDGAQAGFDVHFEDGQKEHFSQVVLATGAHFRRGGFVSSPTVAIGPGREIEAIDLKGKRVAFLGGGDNAFDQYVFARNRGADVCKIFARTVRAQKKLQALVPACDVVVGPFEAAVEHMTVNGEHFDVFNVLFGFEPIVPAGLEQLSRSAQGFVQADHWGQTSIPGVFAVGEVAQTFHPCTTTSFAHGIQAAKAIQRLIGA